MKSHSYGGPFVSKNIGTCLGPVCGIRGGDSDANGDVYVSDFAFWSQNIGKPVNYEGFDNNPDGQTDNKDKNDTWVENLGQSIQYPDENKNRYLGTFSY